MAKKKVKKRSKRASVKAMPTRNSRKGNMGLAIVALILNVLILPGLGSLIGGKTKAGVWQLVLSIVGIILSFVLVGIPILIAAWVWGIVTGVQMIQESR